MSQEDVLDQKYALLFPHLNERQRHLVAAVDAEQLGRGGVALVSRVSGFSRPTVYRAIESGWSGRVPRDSPPSEHGPSGPGAGRRRAVAPKS